MTVAPSTAPPPLPAPAASRPASRVDRQSGSRRPRRFTVVAVGALVSAVVGLGACSGAPSFDREAAISRVVDGGGGVIDRPEAECYVDQVAEELGTGPLAEGAEAQPEQIRRLTAIRIDCFGVDSLGASTSVPRPPVSAVDGEIPEPMAYGEDPALDALWDQCEAGSGLACDQLFDQAPVRSEYEEFAGTCGGRTQELRCADVYTTSTAAPPP